MTRFCKHRMMLLMALSLIAICCLQLPDLRSDEVPKIAVPDEIRVAAEDPLDPERFGPRRKVWDNHLYAIRGTVTGMYRSPANPDIRHQVFLEQLIVTDANDAKDGYRSVCTAQEGQIVPVGGAIGILGQFEGPEKNRKVQRGGVVTRLEDASLLRHLAAPAGKLAVAESGTLHRRFRTGTSYSVMLSSTHREDGVPWAVIRTTFSKLAITDTGRQADSVQKTFKRALVGDELDIGDGVRFKLQGIAVKGEPDERVIGWITLTPIDDEQKPCGN